LSGTQEYVSKGRVGWKGIAIERRGPFAKKGGERTTRGEQNLARARQVGRTE